MLHDITPVILTFDEEPNISRTLSKLHWAREIVVVDSGSRDDTVRIAIADPRVRVVQRPFTQHAEQWNFAIRDTGIESAWILALDADYVLSEDLIGELGSLILRADVSGYQASFVYCVEGRPLRSTVYPPVTVLFRRDGARFVQDGHTQRVTVDGPVAALTGVIFHDDRKPLTRWVASQDRYMRLEAEKLRATESRRLNWPGRIRKLRVVAPLGMLFYCLFIKGLVLDGRAGIFYSLQRSFAELLLSLYLLRQDLSSGTNPTD